MPRAGSSSSRTLARRLRRISVELSEWIWERVGISGVTGPEGAGKSSYLAEYGLTAAKMGGRVYTLPGFDVFRDKAKKELLSIPISLEQLIRMGTMPNACDGCFLPNSIILADQIEQFVNSHKWQSAVADMMTYIFDHRRKMQIGVVYTLQFWQELPGWLRNKTHFLFELRDLYWSRDFLEHPIGRGEITTMTWIDNLGFQHGIPGRRYFSTHYFHPAAVRDSFDSYSKSDPFEKYTKIEIKRRVIKLDPYGLAEDNELDQLQKITKEAKAERTAAVKAHPGHPVSEKVVKRRMKRQAAKAKAKEAVPA